MPDIVVIERSEDRPLRNVFYTVFRHQRLAIWFFLGVILFVSVVTLVVLPETYRSEAKLLVKPGNATMDTSLTSSGSAVQSGQRREFEIKTEVDLLQSRGLAEEVVDALGPEALLYSGTLSKAISYIKSWFKEPNPQGQRDSAVRSFMENCTIDAAKDSSVINISFSARDPGTAQQVVSKFIDLYMHKHIAVYRAPGVESFFVEQAEKLRNELAQTEKALEELKNSTGLASVVDQKRIAMERLGFFQKDMEQGEADLKISLAKIKTMKEMLAQMPEFMVAQNISGFPNVAADGMRQKLYDLQLKEQDLLSRYTEKNFSVQEVHRQIQHAKEILGKEQPMKAQVTKALNTTREQTRQALAKEEANYASYQAKTTALNITLANLREELKGMNKSEMEILRLQREQEIKEANYREYSKKVEQARMDNALETRKISNISIVQAATYSARPDSPRKGRNLALGFAFASFGAIGLAFLLENLDHSFKRPEDVEKQLDLPVLAAIPLLSSGGVSSESAKLTPPMLIPESGGGSETLDEVGEGYEKLCDCLVQQEPQEGQHLLAVTSCHNGEGVSMVAANLAAALARKANQRVLLVEANPYRPSAHLTFGLNNSPGLTDPMPAEEGGNTGRIKRAYDIKLDVLPSGQGGITLARLVDSQEFQEQLSLWKSEYSFVVFDLPPIFKSNSVLRLASQVDGVILVLEAESVSWEVARRAKRLLSQHKAKLVGVVLNKRKFHIPPWIYRNL
jgi:uncharacterized protein involved in exopolysaccharide biosynthesis/Mrp family chromosome partitioning ATPase